MYVQILPTTDRLRQKMLLILTKLGAILSKERQKWAYYDLLLQILEKNIVHRGAKRFVGSQLLNIDMSTAK